MHKSLKFIFHKIFLKAYYQLHFHCSTFEIDEHYVPYQLKCQHVCTLHVYLKIFKYFYRHEINHINLPHWDNIKLKVHT